MRSAAQSPAGEAAKPSAGPATGSPSEEPARTFTVATPRAGDGKTPGPAHQVAALVARMSVEEKVGQLFLPVLYGSHAGTARKENTAQFGTATPAKVIEKYRPGGVILFPWAGNVSSVEQVIDLVNGMQKASSGVPLLVGVDQENGEVSRLSPLITKLPDARTIGDTGDPKLARAAARVTGEELRALGINMDFAPVADVNVNPKNPVIGRRAYGTTPKKVATMVSAAVAGFHDAGVASTVKHFPGHGDTGVDSHTGLPIIDHSPEQWAKLDAPPFRAAISAGVDAVMSAHIVMPELDPSGDPATLSERILTGLLRERLGFDGVVMTDSLQMKGVREKYGDGEVAVRAILAGADMLLMPPDFTEAYDAVLAAVRSGRISPDRLDASVTRILRLKKARGLFTAAPAGAAKADDIVKSAAHRKVAARIARASR